MIMIARIQRQPARIADSVGGSAEQAVQAERLARNGCTYARRSAPEQRLPKVPETNAGVAPIKFSSKRTNPRSPAGPFGNEDSYSIDSGNGYDQRKQ